MEESLQELCNLDGVLGALIAGEDGIVVARHFDTGKDPDRVGALMSSVLLALRRASEEMDIGRLNAAFFEAEKNFIFLTPTPVGHLVLLTTSRANPGLVRLEMRLVADRMRQRAELDEA